MFFLFPEIRDVLASGDATDAAWILTITGSSVLHFYSKVVA